MGRPNLIVFFTDQQRWDTTGLHGNPLDLTPNHKRSCHDSSIRVPTVLSGPGFRGGGQVQELVSLIDLPPTLLEAAGLEVPEAMQGRSILPLLGGRGRAADWPGEIFVQISEAQTGRAVRSERWKYGVDAPGERGPWAERFVEQYLYDLHADPYELANLIDSKAHRPVAEEMRGRLIRRMVEAGERAPEIEPAQAEAMGQRRVRLRPE